MQAHCVVRCLTKCGIFTRSCYELLYAVHLGICLSVLTLRAAKECSIRVRRTTDLLYTFSTQIFDQIQSVFNLSVCDIFCFMASFCIRSRLWIEVQIFSGIFKIGDRIKIVCFVILFIIYIHMLVSEKTAFRMQHITRQPHTCGQCGSSKLAEYLVWR